MRKKEPPCLRSVGDFSHPVKKLYNYLSSRGKHAMMLWWSNAWLSNNINYCINYCLQQYEQHASQSKEWHCFLKVFISTTTTKHWWYGQFAHYQAPTLTWLINHKSHLVCIFTMIYCNGSMPIVDLQPAGPPASCRVVEDNQTQNVVVDWGYMRTDIY